MTQLLKGVRVLDLTTVLSGPYATYQLSLMGADVIKVEVPGVGDLSRGVGADDDLRSAGMGASFVAQNPGKRSITVNLKTAAGRDVFTRLLAESDVLLENMRPGVLARLGFSWEQMHELNPELIYCSLTGFGQTGPLARRPAYDQIIQGLAGMADVTGTPGGSPLRVGFPVCDTTGGLAAAMAICAALAGRVANRTGCFLDVSMLETSLTTMGWVVSDQLIAGRTAQRHGNDNATSAPSGTFQTADGALNIATNTQEQFAALCAVCECPELVTDPRFRTREQRRHHRDELRVALETALKRHDAVEWELLLEDASVPAGRILTVGEALAQDQVVARELVHDIEVPALDRATIQVLGSGVHVNGQALRPTLPPPELGEHTNQILRHLGYTDEEIDTLRSQGAA